MNTDTSASGWYYFKPDDPGGGQVGPVAWGQLVALARSGGLRPGDSVWHASLPGWLPASQIPGLLSTPGVYGPAGAYGAQGRGGRARAFVPWLIPLAVLLLAGLGFGLYFGLRDGEDKRGGVAPTSSTTVSSTSSTATATTGSTGTTMAGLPGTWLVMMYEDADDEILEEDIWYDLNEAEMVGSTDRVKIVAQLDRYQGGYDGDGDVTSAKRYLITQDTDLFAINSLELADLGEVDMGDDRTLYDFATWAISTYPSEHYVLILADHGGGWTGGWSDDDPQLRSGLSMREIDGALGAIVADSGIGQFELVGFDACLMGQLEVMSAVAPHAKYAVGSEETEPSVGWGYSGFLGDLVRNTSMTGRELGQAIVDSYITDDARVTNDQARLLLTGNTDYSAENVAGALLADTTLSAIDLSLVDDLNGAVNGLAVALSAIDQDAVAQARAYAQSYVSVFGEDNPPSFIDLGHFTDLLFEHVNDPGVQQAVQNVRIVLEQAVVAEKHGEGRPGSTGLSVYFPNSGEYLGTFGEWTENYPSSIGRFSAASVWDDYLTYHYTGETFDEAAADVAMVTPLRSSQTDFSAAIEEAAPAADAQIVAPGAADLVIAPITLSADTIGKDDVVTLSTHITGANIAYVYYYVSYYWESDGSYLSADMGYVEPGYVKEVGGIYYPDWGEETVIPVEYQWEPTVYYMSDGNEANDQFAFFEPTVYGEDSSTDIYTVRGTYTFLNTGTQMEAEIDFNGEGDMQGVWGFISGGGGAGQWHEIIPQPGDTFTITDEYLEFDENPDGEFVDYDGGTMTFRDTPFTISPYYAYAGDYVLAIGVEDLDGNVTWQFAYVTVTE